MRVLPNVTTVAARLRAFDLKRRHRCLQQFQLAYERIHFQKRISDLSQVKIVWDTMAPTWILDLMERGERIVVVAHEPPRVDIVRRSRTTWNWIRSNFLRMLV